MEHVEAKPPSAYIPSAYSDKGIHIVTPGASGDMVHGVVIACMKLDGSARTVRGASGRRRLTIKTNDSTPPQETTDNTSFSITEHCPLQHCSAEVK